MSKSQPRFNPMLHGLFVTRKWVMVSVLNWKLVPKHYRRIKLISFKNNTKLPSDTKIGRIQPTTYFWQWPTIILCDLAYLILWRVFLRGWILQIFVTDGGFALFLKDINSIAFFLIHFYSWLIWGLCYARPPILPYFCWPDRDTHWIGNRSCPIWFKLY